MSQFNFPRINVNGKCFLDPATGNNSWYLPLLIFDAISVSCCIPPRVYLHDPYLMQGVTLDQIKKELPDGVAIKEDKNIYMEGAYYVEIEPVHGEDSFKSWARTPLGEHIIDKDYHELYKLVWVPSSRTSLSGIVPGYWNFYGTMSFAYRDIKVTSIATGLNKEAETLINIGDNPIPALLSDILGAKLTMNTNLRDESTNSSVLVDVLPTMSMHTQIFTDKLSLFKGDDVVFSGKPCKASLRNINAFRIVNQNMPFAGSGIFYSAIPIENIDEKMSSKLLAVFMEYGDPSRKLKGVFFRQVVSEIEEERNFDYRTRGDVPNPAVGKLTGSISPWYDGDMISWPGGRQLIGDAPYIIGKSMEFQAPVSVLTPCPFMVHANERLIQLDILNNFPIVNQAAPALLQQPSPYNENHYETFGLGDITFYLEAPGSEPRLPVKLGVVNFSEEKLSRLDLNNTGGMVYLKAPEANDITNKLKNWDLTAYGEDNKGKKIRVWKESPLVIISDQCALYSNQGDDPAKGYRVYSSEKQPCILRIFNRGLPQESSIDVSIFVFKIIASGSDKITEFYRVEKYKDGDIITFETTKPINALYLFYPYRTTKVPEHGYPAAVVQTGFFVNHRVLPLHDFSKYFDLSHPEYIDEVSFEVMHEQVFRTFALLAPTMNFHEGRFSNPSMAFELVKRTSLENWDTAWFMPTSRDLSDDQILLIKKWAMKYISQPVENQDSHKDSSDSHHIEHLKGKSFFQK